MSTDTRDQIAREVAHTVGMRPDDPPLEEHYDCADTILRIVAARLLREDGEREVWRHFKGNLYEVLMRGCYEHSGETCVIYRRADGSDPSVWVRPQTFGTGAWEDWVEVDGAEVPRFERVASDSQSGPQGGPLSAGKRGPYPGVAKVRELLCMLCGRDYPVWFAPNDLWNRVVREPDGSDRWPFLCPGCFATRAAMMGATDGRAFKLSLEEDHGWCACGDGLRLEDTDGKCWICRSTEEPPAAPDRRAALSALYLEAHRAGVEAAVDYLYGVGDAIPADLLKSDREDLTVQARYFLADDRNWTDPGSPLAAFSAARENGNEARPASLAWLREFSRLQSALVEATWRCADKDEADTPYEERQAEMDRAVKALYAHVEALAHPDAGSEALKTGGKYSQNIPGTRESHATHEVTSSAESEARELQRRDWLIGTLCMIVGEAVGDPHVATHPRALMAGADRILAALLGKEEGGAELQLLIRTACGLADCAPWKQSPDMDMLKSVVAKYRGSSRGEEVGNG